MTAGTHYIFECIQCGGLDDSGQAPYLCPRCSRENLQGKPPAGVYKVLYDYHQLKTKPNPFRFIQSRGFLDLLPLKSLQSLPPLRVGNTPLYRFGELNGQKLPLDFYIKDDSQNPTWSFKDRASALVSAYAREHGHPTIVVASTGNAGSSLAGICAAQGQKAVVVLPAHAPEAKVRQVVMYGALALPIRGTYDQAFELSMELTEYFGWYNRNTAYNPLTIEGKKTVAYEIFEQMPSGGIGPIFVSAGDGVILSGVYKGFEELFMLGLIPRVPKIIAIQSALSDNLVRNLHQTEFIAKKSTTLADSISVDAPRNFYMARHYIHLYEGEGITVSDQEILKASVILASNTGIYAEPAAAAAFAGFLSFLENNRLQNEDNPVVMITGSGLKDIASGSGLLKLPAAIDPDLKSVKKRLKKTGSL